MPEFNYPEPSDPEFNSKVLTLLKQLFEHKDNPVKQFDPIATPDSTQQTGAMYYHSDSGTMKVTTPDGVKTLKFE